MFNDNITFLIKERVSILQIINKRINVQKKGNKFLALCPFHKEKTPSFHIDDNKGFFHCFGCGKSGDVFNFLMEYEKFSFKDSLDYLAETAGINLSDYNKQYSKKASLSNSNTTNYYTLLNEAVTWYHNQLFFKENENALKYFLDRGLSIYTIKNFKLGFAPKNNNSLSDYLIAKGYSEDDMVNVGLKYSNDSYVKQDVFKNRVIFPITNKTGKVIAFGGRSLNNDLPKYLNSKESNIFHKRLSLYGLNESLKLLKNKPYIILVEGYIDTIMLQQEGFPAVAPLGTAISQEQINILVKLKIPIYICLDGDEAGESASLKVANMLLEIIDEDTLPKFIKLPKNEDPDSYLRKNSNKSFNTLIENAIPLSEFLWINTIKENKIDTPELKVLYQKKFRTYCNAIQNVNLKDEFNKFFINKLNYLSDNHSIYLKSNNKVIKVNCGASKNGTISDKNNLLRVYFLLAYVITCPEIYNYVEEDFSVLEFDNIIIDNLKQTIVYLLEQQNLNTEELQEELAQRGYSTILNEIMNVEIIKKTLNNLKGVQEFLTVFRDVHSNLLRKLLKKDVQVIKKNVLQNNLLTSKDKLEKVMDHLKILHTEFQQTLNTSKEKL